jgi:hypothetical protein
MNGLYVLGGIVAVVMWFVSVGRGVKLIMKGKQQEIEPPSLRCGRNLTRAMLAVAAGS